MHLRTALIATLLAAIAVGPAHAQVFYDEGDSGGKEYAIPTDDARKQGGANAPGPGGGDSGTGSGSSTGGSDGARVGDPVGAFGAGISSRESRKGGGDASRKGGGDRAGDGSRAAGGTVPNPGGSSPTSALSLERASAEGGSSALWTVGFPLVALLLAAAIAMLIRRRRITGPRKRGLSAAESK